MRDRTANRERARSRRWARLLMLVVAGIAAPAAGVPAAAQAGSYAVLSCPGDEGWSQQAPSALFVIYEDSCADAATGALSLALGPNPDGEYATTTGGAITFSAPSGRTVETYVLKLLAFGGPCAIADDQCANGFGEVYVDHTGQADPDYDYRNLGYGTQAATVDPGKLLSGVTWVTVGVGCDGGPGGDPCPGGQEGGPEALAQISAGTFVLSSSASPTASDFTGSLLEGQAHGTAELRFIAEDPGGPGIYQVTVQVNGNTLYQGTPDGNEGRCAPVGTYEGGILEFEQLQPCKLAEAVAIPIDTTKLPDGQQTLTVTVTDAARESSVVYSGTITTENRTGVSALLDSPLAGALAGELPRYAIVLSERTGSLGDHLRRSYDRSAVTLTGQLQSSNGAAAPGINVTLAAENGNRPAGGAQVLAQTTTNGAGDWSLHVDNGPSRRLRVICGASGTADSVAFTETVRPSLSLHVETPGGGRIVFSGHLAISPLGTPRPLVSIQTRAADGWETVGVPIRVRGNGSYRYVFQSSPVTYGRRFAFRASTPQTSLWQSGISPVHATVIR